jgi:hypothetical protein
MKGVALTFLALIGAGVGLGALCWLGPWNRAQAQEPTGLVARAEAPAAKPPETATKAKGENSPSRAKTCPAQNTPAPTTMAEFRKDLAVADLTDSALASQDVIEAANRAERDLRQRVAQANSKYDVAGFFARGEPDSEFYAEDWAAITRKRHDGNGAEVLERGVAGVVSGAALLDGTSPRELHSIVTIAASRAHRKQEAMKDLTYRLAVIVNLVAQHRAKTPKKAAAPAEDNSVNIESPAGFVLVSHREREEPAKPEVVKEETRRPSWSAHSERVVSKLIDGR